MNKQIGCLQLQQTGKKRISVELPEKEGIVTKSIADRRSNRSKTEENKSSYGFREKRELGFFSFSEQKSMSI